MTEANLFQYCYCLRYVYSYIGRYLVIFYE